MMRLLFTALPRSHGRKPVEEWPSNAKRLDGYRGWKTVVTGFMLSAVAFLAFSPSGGAATVPQFSLLVTPQVPIAGEVFSVAVTTDNFAAGGATFAWFQNGIPQPAASGRGRSSFSFSTDPARAEAIAIRIAVDPGDGFETASQSVTITTIVSPLESLRAAAASFNLVVVPKSPDPGEVVTIDVQTFAFDKQRAGYEWSVNGLMQREASGEGRHSFTTLAPPDGRVVTVAVTATTPAEERQTRSATIRGTRMPVYWWTDTAVPYWYRGKALPVVGSTVTFLVLAAHPEADRLAYQWELNQNLIGRASGLQRKTFAIPLSLHVAEHVTVTARDAAGEFSKIVTTAVQPVAPEVGIYELAPLRGIVAEQLTTFRAPSGDEYHFVAVPFFFPSAAAALEYRWSLNGRAVTGSVAKPHGIRLRSNVGRATANNLSIEVAHAAQGDVRATAHTRADFY